MQLHAFSLQVKNQLEANQLSILESTRKDTSTSEASIELEEDEICALVEKSNNENEEGQHQWRWKNRKVQKTDKKGRRKSNGLLDF